MSHFQEKPLKSGCDLRWMVDATNTRLWFPGNRQRYMIGLRQLRMTCKEDVADFVHICMNPSLKTPTYLPNMSSVYAVRSLFISELNTVRDFADAMEYHYIDFSDTNMVEINVLDNKGRSLNVLCTFMFDLIEK